MTDRVSHTPTRLGVVSPARLDTEWPDVTEPQRRATGGAGVRHVDVTRAAYK